jgi:putative endonuclease
MKYQVYIIQSQKTHRYYIGITKDIKLRLRQHNTGKTRSTKSGIPWKVIKTEEYLSRQEAYKREKQIKRYKGGEALKNY